MTTPPQPKTFDDHLRDFIARGGQVEQCPLGASGRENENGGDWKMTSFKVPPKRGRKVRGAA